MGDIACRCGKTRDQMIGAPYESIYVWVNSDLSYPIRLAAYIQRKDLKIVPPSWLDGTNHRGKYITGITIDHAVYLTDRAFRVWMDIEYKINDWC